MSQRMQTIEVQATTVEEAVEAGLSKLGLPRERVDIEVVDEGRRGLLGIGGRDAVVRLHVRAETAAAPVSAPKAPAQPAPVTVPAPSEKPPAAKAPAAKPARDRDERDEEEAAAAKQVVEALLEKMGVAAAVETAFSAPDDLTNRQVTVVNVTGKDLGPLIGARGETLDALQHVARLMTGQRLHRRVDFVIDVDGYRARREQALSRLAERMAQKAIDRGSPVTLEAMPAYERRVIHMTLRENPRVRTESTGEGDRRRVRIYPQ